MAMASRTQTHDAKNPLQVDIVEFCSLLQEASPVLRSASGEEMLVSDLCAYRDWGILEAHYRRGPGSRSSRFRELITRWRSRGDRRFVFWVARKPETGSSWIYVIRPKVKSWSDCFDPVIEEVLRSRPEFGVLLVEEVRRGDNARFSDIGFLVLCGQTSWQISQPKI